MGFGINILMREQSIRTVPAQLRLIIADILHHAVQHKCHSIPLRTHGEIPLATLYVKLGASIPDQGIGWCIPMNCGEGRYRCCPGTGSL